MHNKTVLSNLAIRMRNFRAEKKITIIDAAKACKLSPTTFGAIENNTRLYVQDGVYAKIETWLQK